MVFVRFALVAILVVLVTGQEAPDAQSATQAPDASGQTNPAPAGQAPEASGQPQPAPAGQAPDASGQTNPAPAGQEATSPAPTQPEAHAETTVEPSTAAPSPSLAQLIFPGMGGNSNAQTTAATATEEAAPATEAPDAAASPTTGRPASFLGNWLSGQGRQPGQGPTSGFLG